MSTWSGIRKKLEADYLCPALRGRVRYFATTYRESHDQEGRAAILVDGGEILKSNYFEYDGSFWSMYYRLGKDASVIKQIVLNRGLFDQRIFYTAFQEFDNRSIESSLASKTPLVRIFALLDRRLGKRRLAALEDVMEKELDWVRPFYRLRMKAEGLRLKSDRKEGDGMERDGYCGHFEWDEPGFEVMRQYILTGGSDLEDALEVFYSAGGYDFFNVVDPRYYGDRWLEFIGNLYSEIDDGKYAPSGKPYKRYAIPLTEEQKRELSSRGVPDVFVTDIP